MKTKPSAKTGDSQPSRRRETHWPPMSEDTAVDPRWRWHYRTLVALRDRLLRESENKRAEIAEPIEPHGSHAADSGTDEFDHDVAIALLAREENALRDITDAITRILEHNYGICEASGAKIPASRLRAVPWCRHALDAERRLERGAAGGRCRVPEAVSLRGRAADVPGTGTITRENPDGPAGQEGDDRNEARAVARAARTRRDDVGAAPGEATGTDEPEG